MQPAITTTPVTMMTTTEAAALSRLLCIASPAFPTGGFAYSHGLEWVVETCTIHDAESLRGWLQAILATGSGRSDAILLRHAFRAAHRPAELAQLAELAAASCPGRERLLETQAQGVAFAASATAWNIAAPAAAYPVAFGAAACRLGITEAAATLGYLTAWMANLVSAGIRLIPLGQSAGLRVLAGLEPIVLSVAAQTETEGLDDIGTACFAVDIASLRHETQYSRMFRS